MFTCVRAIASLRGANQHLTETDVNNVPVRNLMTTYSVCILILTHPALDIEVSLDVVKVVDMFYSHNPDITVAGWLKAIDNADLPIETHAHKIVKSSVLAGEILNAGYKMEMVHPTAGDGNEYHDEELTDIRVTRPGTDYMDLYRHCLVSVNGLLHLTDASKEKLVIVDGGKSVYQSRRNEVGLLSFKAVGGITCYPIAPGMVTGRNGLTLDQGVTITAPGADFSDKYIMVSIGGYLHTCGHQYKVVGDNSVMIEWWNLPIAQRYNDSRHLIDWEPVTRLMTQNPDHEGAFDTTLMNSDACIRAYMTMSQTFIIAVDAKLMFFDNIPVERTGLAGRYYSYTPPVLPLLLENGMIPPYTIHGKAGVYSLAVDDNNAPRYLHSTRNLDGNMGYENDAREYAPLQRYSCAYFMDMYTEKLEY